MKRLTPFSELLRLLTLGGLILTGEAYTRGLLPLALLLLSLLHPHRASAENVRPSTISVDRMPTRSRPSPQSRRSPAAIIRHPQSIRENRYETQRSRQRP